jgi:hypothetical protein
MTDTDGKTRPVDHLGNATHSACIAAEVNSPFCEVSDTTVVIDRCRRMVDHKDQSRGEWRSHPADPTIQPASHRADA